MSDSLITLSAHGFEAVVAPAHGATVMRLTWRGPDGVARDLLHSPQGAVAGAAPRNRFGVWPMLPFANRAFGAVIDDGEIRFPLPENDGAGGAIHGFGWQAAWDVAVHGPDHLALGHRRAEGPDPYRYQARLELALLPGHARIALSVANEAGQALPYGVGLHPWFPAASATRVKAEARGELALGEGYRPAGFTAFAGGGPYAAGRPRPSGAEIAHSLVDWMGVAEIIEPSPGLVIAIDASPNMRHPVLWSPAGADFVCFEPQSHGIGAASEAAARAITPLTRLQPGATLAGWMTLTPRLI
jgi:aldose 1-epimerase